MITGEGGQIKLKVAFNKKKTSPQIPKKKFLSDQFLRLFNYMKKAGEYNNQNVVIRTTNLRKIFLFFPGVQCIHSVKSLAIN